MIGFFTRTAAGFAPADDASAEEIAKIKIGKMVKIEVKQPRNIQHHRLYWALVNLVWQQMDHERYPSPDELSAAFKIAAGIRTRIELPTGAIGFIPGSIAFHKMNQAEFDAFYNRVCDLVCKHFIPGLDDADLKREVSLMIGASR